MAFPKFLSVQVYEFTKLAMEGYRNILRSKDIIIIIIIIITLLLLLLLIIIIIKTIILTVVLYVCETWSFTLREESRLRVFENRILRRIFGPKRDENGEWRRLHNEELHSLYRSPNIVRVIKSRRL